MADDGTRLLTIPQAAERLAYSRRTVERLIESGRLRAVRLGEGHHWRVPEAAIEELVASLESNEPAPYRARLEAVRS